MNKVSQKQVFSGGVIFESPVSIPGDVAQSGDVTQSGLVTQSGGVVSTVVSTAVNLTLTSANSGQVILVTADAKVVSLPATEVGLIFTIVNAAADGVAKVSVSPVAGDAIYGSVANAAADSVSSGADGKDIANTKASANKGDYITLASDGVGGYYIVGGVGIWASES